MTKTIRSVAFDANGVIYYRDMEVSHTVVQTAKDHGIRIPPNAEQIYTELMKQAFSGKFDRQQMIDMILDRWDVSHRSERDLIAKTISDASKVIRLFPEVSETLRQFKELGFGTGIITNTFQSADEKWLWFKEHNIAQYLDHMISSIEVNVAKPDPEIFLMYARRCNLRPEEIAFVGHDLHELRGAETAGMLPLAYRPDKPGSYFPEFDHFPDLFSYVTGKGEANK